MTTYVDTSAAMKLIVAEAESDAVAVYLDRKRRADHDGLVSSLLPYTELHCAANRRGEIPRETVAGAPPSHWSISKRRIS